MRELKLKVVRKGQLIGFERITEQGILFYTKDSESHVHPSFYNKMVKGSIRLLRVEKTKPIELYEGDIIKYESKNEDLQGVIYYNLENQCWAIKWSDDDCSDLGELEVCTLDKFEVIGSIYHN